MFQATKRARVSLFFGSGRVFTDDEADMILDSPQGQHMAQMMKYSAVGTPERSWSTSTEFAEHADADELIVAHQSTGTDGPAAVRGTAGRGGRDWCGSSWSGFAAGRGRCPAAVSQMLRTPVLAAGGAQPQKR